jgi:hypothetical protein
MATAAFMRDATACVGPAGAPAVLAAEWRFPWELCIAVIVLLLAAFLVLALLRRFVYQGADRPEPGMSMEQLERLREQGLISQEEYKRARLSLMPGVGEPARSRQPPGDPDPPDATGPETEES